MDSPILTTILQECNKDFKSLKSLKKIFASIMLINFDRKSLKKISEISLLLSYLETNQMLLDGFVNCSSFRKDGSNEKYDAEFSSTVCRRNIFSIQERLNELIKQHPSKVKV